MAAVAKRNGRRWEPFGVTEADFAEAPERDGVRVVNVTPFGRDPGAQAGRWLFGASIVLGLLAMVAAVVSWQAQYVMVAAVKHAVVIAGLEAGIPDAGAVIFAALGVALALHGRRAVRPRVLNVACVGISLAMNALAAAPGWRDLAIWVMPAGVYALASDTLIGVVRAWALARQQGEGELADERPDLLAALGGGGLWLLRLMLAAPSTLRGFRAWVVQECPVAPGRKGLSLPERPPVPALPAPKPRRARARTGGPTKRDRLIQLAAEQRDLASVPLGEVSKLASALASEIGYSAGTARRELLAHVRNLQSAGSEGQAGDE